jgi:hypothetical protein
MPVGRPRFEFTLWLSDDAFTAMSRTSLKSIQIALLLNLPECGADGFLFNAEVCCA